MKKLFIAIFILLPIVCFADSSGVDFVGVDVSVAGGGSDCPSGTYEIAWNGDHSLGADYFCYESGTASEQGTTQDASVSTSYVEYSAGNDHLTVTITGDISADIDEQGSMFFSFWCSDDGAWGTDALIELVYNGSATENINCRADGANSRVRCDNHGGAQSQNVLATGLSVNTSYRCGYTWDATADTHAVDCVTSGSVAWTSNGGSPDDEDSETLEPFDDSGAVDPDTFALGEQYSNQAVSETSRVWDAYIVTGYKATDPGSL